MVNDRLVYVPLSPECSDRRTERTDEESRTKARCFIVQWLGSACELVAISHVSKRPEGWWGGFVLGTRRAALKGKGRVRISEHQGRS